MRRCRVYTLTHAHVVPLRQYSSLVLPYIIKAQTKRAFLLRRLRLLWRRCGLVAPRRQAGKVNHALYAHIARGRVAG